MPTLANKTVASNIGDESSWTGHAGRQAMPPRRHRSPVASNENVRGQLARVVVGAGVRRRCRTTGSDAPPACVRPLATTYTEAAEGAGPAGNET
jgi:hypothetical protein